MQGTARGSLTYGSGTTQNGSSPVKPKKQIDMPYFSF
jgi:hypothetical protein